MSKGRSAGEGNLRGSHPDLFYCFFSSLAGAKQAMQLDSCQRDVC